MRSFEFFESHPIFTHAEFIRAGESNGRTRSTSNNLLSGHLDSGRIVRVRRGVYATVPRGVDPSLAAVDPFLLATKLADDAAVSYHAALQFAGKTYSVWQRIHYVTRRRARRFEFRGYEYVPVQVPVALRGSPDHGGEILQTRHAGGIVRVTSLERAFVDCLDAPGKGGGWEEIWRSLEMIEYLDLDAVVEYAVRLQSALTVARVGFFLESHRSEMMVEQTHLDQLKRHAPSQPRYIDNSRRPGRMSRAWNLIVPDEILERRWEEAG